MDIFTSFLRWALAVMAFAFAVIAVPATARAASPLNDNFASAHVGQTVAINVDMRNSSHYPEIVQADLLRGAPAGFQQVGSLTQSVAVKSRNRTTRFSFAYLVTEADRSLGKVSFKAVATIIDHRDALPGDNELTSPPVRVA